MPEGRVGDPSGDGARRHRGFCGRRTRPAASEADERTTHAGGGGPGLVAARPEGQAPRERQRELLVGVGSNWRSRARRSRSCSRELRRGGRAPPRGRPRAARATLPPLADAHRAESRLATTPLGGRAQPAGLPPRLQVSRAGHRWPLG